MEVFLIQGYNPAYGARPLRRAIMRLLEDSMAEQMLTGEIKEGDSVILDVDADGQVLCCSALTDTLLHYFLAMLSRCICEGRLSVRMV